MTVINNAQLRCLNTLVSKLHINKEAKEILVSGFSDGRATSSKDLQTDEAAEMIKHLKSLDNDELKAEKMRKKIISMAHEMGWELEESGARSQKLGGRRKADMKRIDEWCKTYGYLKKSLDNHTYKELPKLVSQFEKGPYKHYLSNL
jgi:hypothetical protein